MLQIPGDIDIGNANHACTYAVILNVMQQHLTDFTLNQLGNAANTTIGSHNYAYNS